jgi:heavy metal sensor kinase
VSLTIRARLTLWYTAVLGAILLVFATATYVAFERRLSARRDAQLVESVRALAFTFAHERNEHGELLTTDEVAVETIREFRFRDRHFAIYHPEGRLIALSDNPDAVPEARLFASGPPSGSPVGRALALARMGLPAFSNDDAKPERLRLYGETTTVGGTTYIVLVAGQNDDQLEWLAQVRRVYAVLIPLALLAAAGGGYLLARKSFAPVMRMCAEAERIGAEDLSRRLTAQPDDELGRLAGSFNGLLGRLAHAIDTLRRFTSDASHELRTPIAIIQGESDVALSRSDRTPDEYRESLDIIRDESRRTARIVEDLFTLTRADAGQLTPLRTRFDLGETITDTVHSLRTLAARKNIRMTGEINEELSVLADESLLRQLLRNLLENAIKYTPDGGWITVTVEKTASDVLVHIADTGPGIPPADRTRIFERFHRARRTATNGGAGLGLAIAAEIARAHGGDLTLTRSDEKGSIFTFKIGTPLDRAHPARMT